MDSILILSGSLVESNVVFCLALELGVVGGNAPSLTLGSMELEGRLVHAHRQAGEPQLALRSSVGF